MTNILCFGDSITWGYYDFGMGKHPYCNALKEHLKKYYKVDKVNMVEQGVNGETVVTEMENRLKDALKAAKYDYVILLGGLNDLADISVGKKTIENVMSSFMNMYKTLDENKHVRNFFHITIPLCRPDNIARYRDAKRELNDGILMKLNSEKRYIVDITDHEKYGFNYTHLTSAERKKYWDDTLHYTPAGYDLLAECVFLAFKDNVSPESFKETSDESSFCRSC